MSTPSEPPPSYAVATGSSTTSAAPKASSHLQVPKDRNGIPALARRSMEDLQRPLPQGWVRSYDPKENHQFFVNTKEDPPKSYWEHPLDIPEVVRSLSSEERERLQEEEDKLRKQFPHSADHSEDEGHANEPPLPPRPSNQQRPSTSKAPQKKTFGEKLKDKVTGTTHEERVLERAKREEEERQYYEAHLKLRQAMQKAQMTGQPQFFAKDKDGKDIYIEPPGGPGYGYGGYGPRGYGINPYAQGPYSNPNVRVIRPGYPYNRPYGPYSGGGAGLPIAGGLLGGMLLGGLLF
ncbi:hypothetical protein A1O3_00642 [Capronia epimyces CBS 606.96]|uniref:WW domain-containing protein n=1 Tax=Capronia epimyces CBS 606.96 TaxID=1182542 RepID=W9YGR5_9EURO|nr:uncharacterized protein A1O3_00642 [Capronia epimyces CBS 606.96]EXJ92092.1 hypothetical protein A1O3_00642 [Capronia epimyces CBS 606.96]